MLNAISQYGQAIAFAGAIIAAVGVALSSINESRLQSQLIEAQGETLRQVTGDGGFSFLIPQINIADRREQIQAPMMLLNNSEYPVFGVVASVMQRVPVGEGLMGSDGVLLFRGSLGDVYPGSGPQATGLQATLHRDRDNIFDIVLFTRAGTFGQRLVITWADEQWQYDYQLKNLSEGKRGTPEEVIHDIRVDFPYQNANQNVN